MLGRSTPERRPLAPVPKPARGTTAKARRVPATKPRTRVRRSGGVDTAPAGGGTTDRHSGGTRAKGAERRQQVIELIRARPGITVPDVSQEHGLEPPPVYRVIRKLQASGIVIKEGSEPSAVVSRVAHDATRSRCRGQEVTCVDESCREAR